MWILLIITHKSIKLFDCKATRSSVLLTRMPVVGNHSAELFPPAGVKSQSQVSRFFSGARSRATGERSKGGKRGAEGGVAGPVRPGQQDAAAAEGTGGHTDQVQRGQWSSLLWLLLMMVMMKGQVDTQIKFNVVSGRRCSGC